MKRPFAFFLALLFLTGVLLCACAEDERPDDPLPDEGGKTEPGENTPDQKPEKPGKDDEPSEPEETEEQKIMKDVANYNYMIGTQAFSPSYQFTKKTPLMEIGGEIMFWGSNAIKFYATSDKMVDTLLKEYDFKYVFMWYRSDPVFKDGYSEAEANADYKAFYNYTKKLLTTYNGTGKEFYLGHWEGDWYYIDNYNTAQKTVSDTVTDGMIAWLNNRQKAVDDAKRDTPHEGVEVWNYVEVNRPTDVLKGEYDRVVNRVLPYTNVDYVSYSAYDCQDMTEAQVADVIRKIYEYLPEKEGVPGPRVFIGEFGQPAVNCGYDEQAHCKRNMGIFKKYLQCDVKFVLYWQMYCNEKQADGTNRGFWLIDSDGTKTELYWALESVLSQAKEYVRAYRTKNGRVPTMEEYKEFLLGLEEFQ